MQLMCVQHLDCWLAGTRSQLRGAQEDGRELMCLFSKPFSVQPACFDHTLKATLFFSLVDMQPKQAELQPLMLAALGLA